MLMVILALICTLLFLAVVLLRRVYFCVPAKELRRLARSGDPLGVQLYRPVAYGAGFSLLLWLLVGTLGTASVVLWTLSLPLLASPIVVFLVLLMSFGWAATAFPRARTVEIAAHIAPLFAWILMRTQPVSERLGTYIRSRRSAYIHTGVYEKEDLAELLALQKTQQDSRVTNDDVELMERALQFGDKTATDVLSPRKDLRTVNVDDAIGPILLGELHDSGATNFLAYEGKKDHLVGSVSLLDLIQAKTGGKVKQFVQAQLIYVREDFSLLQVLNAFQQSGQQLVIVINNHKEFLGVVRLGDLLAKLTGEAQDEGIAYDDPRAVAEYKPKEPELVPEQIISLAEQSEQTQDEPASTEPQGQEQSPTTSETTTEDQPTN
jgi:CBS domain containing-hemolysin-like protein